MWRLGFLYFNPYFTLSPTTLLLLYSLWIVTIFFVQKQWNHYFISTVSPRMKNIANGDGIYFKYAVVIVGAADWHSKFLKLLCAGI